MKELDRISSAIGDIERFFDDMSRMRICEEVSEEDLKGFYAASMVLLAVINRAIDLANEVILLYGWEEPFSYAEAFRVLERQEVIDKDLCRRLVVLVRLRNFLSHEYHRATERDIRQACELIGSVREFVAAVEDWIKRYGGQ